jgi:hypothetical protein
MGNMQIGASPEKSKRLHARLGASRPAEKARESMARIGERGERKTLTATTFGRKR